MSIQYTTTVLNSITNYVTGLIDASSPTHGTLEFRTNLEVEAARLTFSLPAFGSAVAGVATANAITADSNAVGGIVNHAVILNGSGVEVLRLSVTEIGGGGDIEINNAIIGASQRVNMTSLTYEGMTLMLGPFNAIDSGTIFFSTDHSLAVTGELDTSSTAAALKGITVNYDTNGANAINVKAMEVYLNYNSSHNYTGSGLTRAIDIQNSALGSHSLGIADTHGNHGATIQCQVAAGSPQSVGDRVGVYAIANGGQTLNAAVYARSFEQNTTLVSSSVVNVGVIGVGGHFGGHGSQSELGAVFAPSVNSNWYTDIANPANVWHASVLTHANGVAGAKHLISVKAGAVVLEINDDGSLTLHGAVSGSSMIGVPSNAGVGTIFRLPSSNGTVGQSLKTDGSGNTFWG